MASALLSRERNFILLALMVMAIAAWAVVVWQSEETDGRMSPSSAVGPGSAEMQSMGSSRAQPTTDIADVEMAASSNEMGMSLTMDMGAGLFLAVWVAMMVAMMFPTSAPMILTFAKIQNARAVKKEIYVPTWLFVLAYIALWSAAGVLAFGVASLADRLAEDSAWLSDNAARIGGFVLIVAGLYQLSPLKDKCLSQCRTPTTFIMTRWREGRAGAVRMGLEHGVYCLGCCWFLFVILFPLGMANVAAMAGITLLIFAEKTLAIGRQVAQTAAVALVAYGALVLLVLPDALPTNMTFL